MIVGEGQEHIGTPRNQVGITYQAIEKALVFQKLQRSSPIGQCHLNPVNERNDLTNNQKKYKKPKF